MTKICVPTAGRGGLEDSVGEHFGRVPTYTIVDTETQAVDIIDNTSEHAGGMGLPADILASLGIDVLLCKGAGRRAIDILAGKGIEVCIGVGGTAGEAVSTWEKGTLTRASGDDACQQHTFHDSEKHDS